MGFNNDGAEAVLRRLASRAHLGGIVGVNVGANKDSADRIADYVKLIETFAPVASYFTVNVSSPNTPGLRNLQQSAALDELLARVIDARERVRKNAGDSPVLLKIAPDLESHRTRRRRADRALAPRRRHDRRQHHAGAALDACAKPTAPRSRADCRDGRCFGCRRAWWRRPMCAPRARFR